MGRDTCAGMSAILYCALMPCILFIQKYTASVGGGGLTARASCHHHSREGSGKVSFRLALLVPLWLQNNGLWVSVELWCWRNVR
jgi:hypothetical protein